MRRFAATFLVLCLLLCGCDRRTAQPSPSTSAESESAGPTVSVTASPTASASPMAEATPSPSPKDERDAPSPSGEPQTPGPLSITYDPTRLGLRSAEVLGAEGAAFYSSSLVPAIIARETVLGVPSGHSYDLRLLIDLFRYTCPLEEFAKSVSVSDDGGSILIDYGDYASLSDEEYAAKINAVGHAIETAVSSCVRTDFNRLETILALYKYLAANVVYDHNAENFRAYCALVNGACNCNGYSEALMVLLTALDMDEGYLVEWVSDDPDVSSHMWNAIMLDGEWYYFDVTWESGSHSGAGLTYFGINNTFRSISYPPEEYNIAPVSMGIPVPDVTSERFSFLEYCGLAYAELDTHSVRFYAPAESQWYLWNTRDGTVVPS